MAANMHAVGALTKGDHLPFCGGSVNPTVAACGLTSRVDRPKPMQSTSDEVLIGRIANGDRLAMQVLYARYHVRVFRFVARLVRNETTAEDLISEVFLDVWRQLVDSKVGRRCRHGCWPSRVSRPSRHSDVGRTRSWTKKLRGAIEDSSDDPATALEKKDKSAIIRKCLMGHLRVLPRESVEEVAEIVAYR